MRIRPSDWKTPKYWLHLGIIAVIVLGLLQLLFGGDMFSWRNVLISIPLIGIADITAHTLLQME